MKALVIILTFIVNNVFAKNSLPDTLKYFDKPDFYEIFTKHGDTSYFTSFITEKGFLIDEDSGYESAIMCRITLAVDEKLVGLKEFINKGNGFWYAIFYDNKYQVIMQGLIRETGKIYTTGDTIRITSPEPPYKTRDIAYRYHQTVREGVWISYDRQFPFDQHKIYYENGMEQREKK